MSFLRSLAIALATVLGTSVFSFSALAAVADPWDGEAFSGEPKAIATAAAAVPAGDSDVVTLLDEAHFTFDAAGRMSTTRHMVYRIVSESGVEDWSTIEVPWSPWYQERPTVDARVISSDGAVHRLESKELSDAPEGGEDDIFSDGRVLRGPLPAVQVGSIIEERITYRDANPMYEAGVTQRFNLGDWVPVHRARLILEYPSTLALGLANHSSPHIEGVRSEKDGIVRLQFEASSVPAIEHYEWNLPSDVPRQPYIAFSTGKSWQEVAKHYSDIVDRQIAAAPPKGFAAAAASGVKERRAVIDRILAALERDVRYAGVEFGANAIVPHTPAETIAHKYGDCKDKATLLVAALRDAGIPAHVALLESGFGLDVDRDLPGMGQFNHAIVVTDGDDPMWIDPTDEYARAGELPGADQGRLALIADPGSTALVRTPEVPSTANRIVETREFFLAEDGNARVVESTESHGSSEAQSRRSAAGSDAKSYRESLESYLQNVYAAKELTAMKNSDPHDLSKPFTLRLEAANAGRGQTRGGEGAVALWPSALANSLPYDLRNFEEEDPDATAAAKEKAKKDARTHDFVTPEPYFKEWHYVVHPPEGYTPRALPDDGTIQVGTATLTKSFSKKEDGTVEGRIRFDSGPRRITVAQYDEMRRKIYELSKEDATMISFDQVAKLKMEAGDVRGALAEHRRLSALHPKEALHHTQAALDLLQAGLGDAARAEINRATQLEPKSASAWFARGTILTTDSLGRDWRKGIDVPGAVASLRKAKELEPTNRQYRATLAIVLERGDDGIRFGKGSHAADAIAELLAIKKETKAEDDNAGVDRELMSIYSNLGMWKELEALTRTTQDDKKDMFRVVAAGGARGADAAVELARSLDVSRRSSVMVEAGSTLATVRQYQVAAALLAAGAAGNSDANSLKARAELMRRAKRHEDMPMPPEDPATVVRKLLVQYMSGAIEPESVLPLMSKEAADMHRRREALKKPRFNAKESEVLAGLRSATRSGVPPAFLADLALSGIDLQVEGTDAVGYRVKMRASMGASAKNEYAFVVRESAGYRMLGGPEDAAEVGLHVVALADAGDLAAARQWLDWTRESYQGRGVADDPYGLPPFMVLWTRGNEAAVEDIRIAAASLLVSDELTRKDGIAILEKARKNEATPRAAAIDNALATAYQGDGAWEKQLTQVKPLYDRAPESESAFEMVAQALTGLERRAELQQFCDSRLAKFPHDRAALRALANDAVWNGEYDKALTVLTKIIDSADPDMSDYNDRAWFALFAGSQLTTAIEDGRRAVEVSGDAGAALNTLAALHAEAGNSTEALQMVLKRLDQTSADEPSGPDWYVLGRIAENYGMPDAAISAYRKVGEQPKRVEGSAWQLAQRRLQAMKK